MSRILIPYLYFVLVVRNASDKSESDSELSSYEQNGPMDPWVNRRQQAVNKKKHHRSRRGGPDVGPLETGDDTKALIQSDQLDGCKH